MKQIFLYITLCVALACCKPTPESPQPQVCDFGIEQSEFNKTKRVLNETDDIVARKIILKQPRGNPKSKVTLLLDFNGHTVTNTSWNYIPEIVCEPSGLTAYQQQKYGSIRGAEKFGATIECYTYPDEWKACDGHATPVPGVSLNLQTRKAFGMCYRSKIGNDTDGIDHGYKLNLIYNCTSSPSEKAHESINDSPEAGTMSFEISSTPVNVTGYGSTSLLEIDSTTVIPAKLALLEAALYGTKDKDAFLPLPDAVIAMLKA